ncbi:GlsB/YeaQ/YmgE family stress response membrane protein [Bosea sp. (in: a-proteobacteria)]|uniref:GlsB/YeaQ/YmgE family stress response membrane protein n=1 Tax=Bosea sp. (in: a-proteobacteria) TaxID=1871050 RepID=UPI002FCC6DDE
MNNEIVAALGTPGYGFFMTLLIGIIAGWIAERVTSSDHGLFTNMIVGVAGSFVGSRLGELLEIPVFGFWRTLTAAIAGACILIVIWRAMRN